jgi:hypothetical protein
MINFYIEITVIFFSFIYYYQVPYIWNYSVNFFSDSYTMSSLSFLVAFFPSTRLAFFEPTRAFHLFFNSTFITCNVNYLSVYPFCSWNGITMFKIISKSLKFEEHLSVWNCLPNSYSLCSWNLASSSSLSCSPNLNVIRRHTFPINFSSHINILDHSSINPMMCFFPILLFCPAYNIILWGNYIYFFPLVLFFICFFFLFLCSFIHICIHCLGHFSPLSPSSTLPPSPLTCRQNLFYPCL